MLFKGFPGGSVVKNLPANAGDVGLIPGSGKCPGEGNGSSVQYYYYYSFIDHDGYSISYEGFLPAVVDTMVI